MAAGHARKVCHRLTSCNTTKRKHWQWGRTHGRCTHYRYVARPPVAGWRPLVGRSAWARGGSRAPLFPRPGEDAKAAVTVLRQGIQTLRPRLRHSGQALPHHHTAVMPAGERDEWTTAAAAGHLVSARLYTQLKYESKGCAPRCSRIWVREVPGHAPMRACFMGYPRMRVRNVGPRQCT